MVTDDLRRKQYTIRLPPEASESLKEMANEEQISVAELIRRAINFYDVKLEAKKNEKKIVLEDKEGKREWVMV
jgi:hypothetical protein